MAILRTPRRFVFPKLTHMLLPFLLLAGLFLLTGCAPTRPPDGGAARLARLCEQATRTGEYAYEVDLTTRYGAQDTKQLAIVYVCPPDQSDASQWDRAEQIQRAILEALQRGATRRSTTEL